MEFEIGLGGAWMVMCVISMVGKIELGETKQRKAMGKASSLLLMMMMMMMMMKVACSVLYGKQQFFCPSRHL